MKVERSGPRLWTLVAELKKAIHECFDGGSYFGCLEQGVDFGGKSATAFASIRHGDCGAVICLQTWDESSQELLQRLVPFCGD